MSLIDDIKIAQRDAGELAVMRNLEAMGLSTVTPGSLVGNVTGKVSIEQHNTFKPGDRVRKKSGAEWQGKIVGWYSTKLTPEGYAVESESHPGSVQIYPKAALEFVN